MLTLETGDVPVKVWGVLVYLEPCWIALVKQDMSDNEFVLLSVQNIQVLGIVNNNYKVNITYKFGYRRINE